MPRGRSARLVRVLRDLPGQLVNAVRTRIPEPSFAAALSAFVESVRSGTEASPDLRDGLACLEVLTAAEQSLEARVAVAVSERRKT